MVSVDNKKQERVWTFKKAPYKGKKTKESPEKERLAKWIVQEITSREYTQKEIDALCYLVKKGKREEAWKILLKGHKCPITCYCQKEAKTWKEKINKARTLLELAEREGNEARTLRIRETVGLLTQQLKQHE